MRRELVFPRFLHHLWKPTDRKIEAGGKREKRKRKRRRREKR